MTALPQLFPRLSIHLADRSLTPLVSSAATNPSAPGEQQSKQDALTKLASTAVTVHDAALRLGLGAPHRVMVDYGPPGPLVIQTFLDPAAVPEEPAAPKPPTAASGHLAPHRPLPHRGLSSSSAIKPSASRPASTTRDVPPQHDDEPALDRLNGSSPLARSEWGSPALPRPIATAAAAAAGAAGAAADDHDNDDNDHASVGKHDSENPAAQDKTHGNQQGDAAPMLVGVVVCATTDDAADARRATVRLEKIGREIQRRWSGS